MHYNLYCEHVRSTATYIQHNKHTTSIHICWIPDFGIWKTHYSSNYKLPNSHPTVFTLGPVRESTNDERTDRSSSDYNFLWFWSFCDNAT